MQKLLSGTINFVKLPLWRATLHGGGQLEIPEPANTPTSHTHTLTHTLSLKWFIQQGRPPC